MSKGCYRVPPPADFFNDDPAGVLADYKAKQEEAKKEREKEGSK